MPLAIRHYHPRDAGFIAAIFYESVRSAGLRDYSPQQVQAWAPALPDQAVVAARAGDGRMTLVAVNQADEPVAYIDLECSGHIDHFYCRPAFIGTGAAALLYARLEHLARLAGVQRLFVEASESARRFFLKQSYSVIDRQNLSRNGVAIHNYRMEKWLHVNPASAPTSRTDQ